ncbi:hypothetical protein E1A91_D07G101600v1, partial [Gossypium mustelinum]
QHSCRKKKAKERKKNNCSILSFISHAGILLPFQLRLKRNKGTDDAPPLVEENVKTSILRAAECASNDEGSGIVAATWGGCC